MFFYNFSQTVVARIGYASKILTRINAWIYLVLDNKSTFTKHHIHEFWQLPYNSNGFIFGVLSTILNAKFGSVSDVMIDLVDNNRGQYLALSFV